MSYAISASAQRVRSAAGAGLPSFLLGLGVAPVLAANGGYFPTSWGWAGVVLAWTAVVAAAVADMERPSTLELMFVGGLVAVTVWLALSLQWTTSTDQTGLELLRTLVYVAAALAVITLVRVEEVGRLLAGVTAGTTIVCAYAVATRLFPRGTSAGDVFSGSRLATPVGYWNGLGVVAAMGTLLALVFAARAARPWARGLASAAVPILLVALYFTFSRGAWVSLLFGLIVLFAADRARVQLLAAAAPGLLLGAVVVAQASGEDALTHTSAATLQTAVHQGRNLGVVLVVACLIAGYAGYWTRSLDRLVEKPQVARVARWVVAAAIVVVVVGAIARYGSPTTLARHGYDSFTGAPAAGTNLNNRLFSLSSNGRITLWHVAWHAFKAHEVTGLGAGGYEAYWNQHRPGPFINRDAHNFYLETLAEEGIVGAVIFFGAMAIPFFGLRRARRDALGAGALAVYATYLFHSIADWDWELAGVTLIAVFSGAAVLALGRRQRPAGHLRWPVLAASAAVGLVTLAGFAARLELKISNDAATAADWGKAASAARHARTLMPWSGEPWQALGAAQLGRGDRAAAVDSYRHAVEKNPDDYRTWIALATAERGQPRWRDLGVAVSLNPADTAEIQDIAQQLLAKDGP